MLNNNPPKIAIVVDWLVTYAGAERCLEQMLICFPDADLFSVVDFIPDDKRAWLAHKKAKTTFIQNLPFAKKKYRSYLPLMPLAMKGLDVSGYDVVISSSHAVAKGVKTRPDQLHICYIHSPMRYAWDLRDQYLSEAGLNKGLKSKLVNFLLNRLKAWDLKNSDGVTHFIANSQYIAARVKRCYDRGADVIYPPVDVENFQCVSKKEDFYLTASRMVPYKKINLIVEAFSKMPDKKLVVIGAGPDFEKIKALAADNIELLGFQPTEVLRDYMQRAKAFVFAAEEDFGIVPVEAQACGTPVIAYGKGGALETVVGLDQVKPTGVFFDTQTSQSLIDAVRQFEKNQKKITSQNCRKNSEHFTVELFRKNILEAVLAK